MDTFCGLRQGVRSLRAPDRVQPPDRGGREPVAHPDGRGGRGGEPGSPRFPAGVEPEKIEVALEDGILTIAGETSAESQEQKGDFLLRERRWGKFHRALKLPAYVDADRAEPKYVNGVLTITLPKREASKARRLEVSAD